MQCSLIRSLQESNEQELTGYASGEIEWIVGVAVVRREAEIQTPDA
jgi:hypothetical protein